MEPLRDVILHVLRLAGPSGIGRTVLIKLVYFAQLESWRQRGVPLTKVSFYSYKYGAFAPEVTYVAENLPAQIEGSKFYNFYTENRYRLRDDAPPPPDLSPAASAILERVFKDYGHMTAAAIGGLSKRTEPMKHAEQGVPLDFTVVAPPPLRVRNSALARAQAELDLTEHGSREELHERELTEFHAWSPARGRANGAGHGH